MAEIRLVLVKTPKLRWFPWERGSWARTVAPGIAYRSVGLPGKASWERERTKSEHPVAPRLSVAGRSRRSERSPAGLGFAAQPQTWPCEPWLRAEGKGLPGPWEPLLPTAQLWVSERFFKPAGLNP